MDYGLLAFPSDLTMHPADLAREAEDRRFESIFYPEHSHLPTDSGPWPGGPVVPDHYANTLDLFTALGAAAAVTSTIKLGSGICLVPQHDPIWLAKQVASIDHISNGRFVFGIGFGWNKPELAHHGVDYPTRRARTADAIAAMKTLWSDEDVVEYHGDHVDFGPSQAYPKPTQRPHPPILLAGGAGPKLRSAVVSWADGWCPIAGRDEILSKLPEFRDEWKAAGRDPDAFQVTAFGVPPEAEAIETHIAAGVDRIAFGLPIAGRDTLLPTMDKISKLIGT